MKKILIKFLILFSFISCMPQKNIQIKNNGRNNFEKNNNNKITIETKNNKKIAIIAGIDIKRNMYFVKHLEQAFSMNTTLEVVKQWKIKKIIKDYPYKIRGPYKDSFIEIYPEYKNTDKSQVKLLFNKLDVDYIAIVWMPVTGNIETVHGFPVIDPQVSKGLEKMYYIMQVFEKDNINEIYRSIYYYLFEINKDNRSPFICNLIAKNIGSQLGVLR